MAEITLDVKANLSEDAKFILNRMERLDKQRLETIADIYRFTVATLVDYGNLTDESGEDGDGDG